MPNAATAIGTESLGQLAKLKLEAEKARVAKPKKLPPLKLGRGRAYKCKFQAPSDVGLEFERVDGDGSTESRWFVSDIVDTKAQREHKCQVGDELVASATPARGNHGVDTSKIAAIVR